MVKNILGWFFPRKKSSQKRLQSMSKLELLEERRRLLAIFREVLAIQDKQRRSAELTEQLKKSILAQIKEVNRLGRWANTLEH